MNRSGKTSTIFLVVLSVFFVSTTGISAFFFLKEAEKSNGLTVKVEELKGSHAKLQGDLQETQKQLTLAEDKKKEYEKKIDDMSAELQVEQGVKEDLKKQNQQLTETLDQEKQSKEQLRQQLSNDLASAEDKVKEFQQKLDLITKQKDEIETRRIELQKQVDELKAKADELTSAAAAPDAEGVTEKPAASAAGPAAQNTPSDKGVQLGTIVVNPEQPAKTAAVGAGDRGKIITIDPDAEFLIVSLGSKDGVKADSVMSVYRGDKYLGDVKATRVLEEMTAVDFVAPLNSKAVTKEDRVVLKQ